MDSPPAQGRDLAQKLKWLMTVRVLAVTILLGTFVLFQIGFSRGPSLSGPFYFLIGAVYILTLLYALSINQVAELVPFSYLQLSLDLLLETALAAFTGGVESPFTFLFLITIISGSVLLYQQGGMIVASLACAAYTSLVAVPYFYKLPFIPVATVPSRDLLYTLFLNITAFYTVAYLSGRLAEQLRQTGESLQEKAKGLTRLQVFHENVVQSMSGGLFTTDLSGRITSFNRAGEEITGFTKEEILGKSWWELFSQEDPKIFGYRLETADVPFRFDTETRRKEGARLLLGVTLTSLLDDRGQKTGIVGMFQDLTKIRAIEEEMKKKEKMASIGELAASMAHEIRNPLAALSGSMQVLKRELKLEEEDRRLMEIALKEAERLNTIITTFLKYARPMPLNKKRCSLHDLLEDTLSLLRNSPDYRDDITLVTKFTKGKVWMMMDPDQIKQVFWNVVLNAIEAMPNDGQLTIETRRLKTPRHFANHQPTFPIVEIRFKDTGVGIVPEDLERIFYPFFTTKQKGSGLGLSIVHRIIEEHGGRILVESKPGRGTTMILQLPVEKAVQSVPDYDLEGAVLWKKS
jgi:two-component system sensor histidine kinase PilS (NtrC family)